MRWNLLKTYDKIYTIDLHGNAKKKEVCPDGSPDENVFDIMQGVSINFFIKTGKKKNNELGEYYIYDLFGKREAKYRFLLENSFKSIEFKLISTFAPNYILKFQNEDLLDDYNNGLSLLKLFPINAGGFTTHRDNFAVDFNENEMLNRALTLMNSKIDDLTIRTKYEIKDNRDWNLSKSRKDIQGDKKWNEKIIKCNYRPFDNRSCYFSNVMMDYPRKELIQHSFRKDNLLLGVGRQGSAIGNIEWCLVTISKTPVDTNVFRRGGVNLFPLYLYPDKQSNLLETSKRKPNLNPEIVDKISENLELTFTNEQENTENTFAPIDLLDYIYAVLHSPYYRDKYKEFLKIDFPKIPYPINKNNFRQLVKIGSEIRLLHLLESDKVKEYITTYPNDGSNKITKSINSKDWELYDAENNLGRIWLNDEQYFNQIPLVAWEFYIGGYQPAQKWLKDRRERELSFDDILHYQKIIVALYETSKLMKEIDLILIDK